uniref:DNA repair protein SWI5 homolog n=1 Tax=Saimiri boliviensis boliviensis TaxID=39432 RepID=A0A2K6UPI9_SAIBB
MGEGSTGPGPRSLETRGGPVWGGRRTESGLTRSCRGAFRSPVSMSGIQDQAGQHGETLSLLKLQKRKKKKKSVNRGYSVDELEDHITQLHEYNDIKDVGQMLMGKLAMIRGVTTKELYPEFGLDMND